MTTYDDVEAVAEHVRRAIRSDPLEGATALVMFASSSAFTTKLKHEALLLKFSQSDARLSAATGDLEKQMLDLVDRIALDHTHHLHDKHAAEQQRAWQTLRTRLRAEPYPTEPIVQAKGLGKRYPNNDFHLQGVDLVLRSGDITGLVGQNAHGKTTLLRMVAGELRADEGSVSYPMLAKSPPHDWIAVKSQIAYMPQELPPWRGSLLNNLHYTAALRGLRGQDNEREVQFIVERLDLRPHLYKTWSGLSGGYKLRFALAQVLLGKPKLLILDEPLANLDVVAQAKLLQDITDLARSRRFPLAVLMSSQHLHELEAVASTMIFLKAGEVMFNGPVNAIGSTRDYNLFELDAIAQPGALREALGELLAADPQHNGVSYVLRTHRNVGSKEVLRRLIEHGIAVSFFRDVSRSVKSMFD